MPAMKRLFLHSYVDLEILKIQLPTVGPQIPFLARCRQRAWVLWDPWLMSAKFPPSQFPSVLPIVSNPPALLPTTVVFAREAQTWPQSDMQGNTARVYSGRDDGEVCLQTSMKTAPCSLVPN